MLLTPGGAWCGMTGWLAVGAPVSNDPFPHELLCVIHGLCLHAIPREALIFAGTVRRDESGVLAGTPFPRTGRPESSSESEIQVCYFSRLPRNLRLLSFGTVASFAQNKVVSNALMVHFIVYVDKVTADEKRGLTTVRRTRRRRQRLCLCAVMLVACAVATASWSVEDSPERHMPRAWVNYIRRVVAYDDGRLALPSDVAEDLRERCTRLRDYKPMPLLRQCDDNVYEVYEPSDAVLAILANETGTTLSPWCRMPMPQRSAQPYWQACVLGGYLNVLTCEAGEISAVLGFAALEPHVCYPAHRHMAQEAYWQIGGGGYWRTWDWLDEGLDSSGGERWRLVTELDLRGAKEAFHVNHREHPHEFDTTHDQEPMAFVYWWGLDSSLGPNNYRWAPEVTDDDDPDIHSCSSALRSIQVTSADEARRLTTTQDNVSSWVHC